MARELWLGDALRALHNLAPDAEAAETVLRMLGLAVQTGAPPSRAAVVALPPNRSLLQQDALDKLRERMPAEQESILSRPRDAGDAGWRLPSLLQRTTGPPYQAPPAWLSSAKPLQITAAGAASRAAAPLLSRQRRRAILAAALCTRVAEGEPDTRRIIAELGRGRPLRRVPRRLRGTLRHGVELRIDRAPWLRPFHDDQLQLREALLQLLTPERVHTVFIDGGPQALPAVPRRAKARHAANAQRTETHTLPPRSPTPVLLLSDLGAGYRAQAQSPSSIADWRAWFATLSRQGRHAVVLTPAAGFPVMPGTALLPWTERTTLGDALRARAGQAPRPPAVAPGATLLELARQLSPVLLASPWLLRETRRALHLPPSAEADLCFSELVLSFGRGGLALDPEIAGALRAQLAESAALEPALARANAARLAADDGSAIEEALIALELRGQLNQASAEHALQPALRALSQGGDAGSAVAGWAAHAWTRMSPAARATAAARQMAYAASAQAGQSSWLAVEGAAAPSLPAAAPWLFGGVPARKFHSVELRRYADDSVNLVIGPAAQATTALHRIELPDLSPVWLQVVHHGRSQAVAVAENEPTQVDLPDFVVDEPIHLRTLYGDEATLVGRASLATGLDEAWLIAPGTRGLIALVVAPGLALVPPGLAALEPGTLLELRKPSSSSRAGEGPVVRARVVGVDSAAPLGALALELINPPEELVPLDCSPRRFDAAGNDARDTAISLNIFGEIQEITAPSADGPGLAQASSLKLPALVIPANGGAWQLVSPQEDSNSPGARTVVPLPELIAWAERSLARFQPFAGKDDSKAPQAPVGAAAGAPRPLAAVAPPSGSLRARFVAMIENREDKQLGLFRIAPEQGFSLVPVARVPDDRPIALFVHGITADVQGNFGPLWKEDTTLRERLVAAYPDALFAWNYRSLTVGPLANAVALMKTLPFRVRLHLVTYSGGGFIGELLCRSMREGQVIDPEDQDLMRAQTSVEPGHEQLLREFSHVLSELNPRIERFVRISAPIEGSAIYAGGVKAGLSLARALPYLGPVISALPGVESLFTDATLVPGPASMIPGAGVQPLLTRRVRVNAPLSVITGIKRATSLLERAWSWVSSLSVADPQAPSGDHWVSVASALGGMERSGGVDYLIEDGDHVDHAAYLDIPNVRRAVVDALLAEGGTPPGFLHADSLSELHDRHAPRVTA